MLFIFFPKKKKRHSLRRGYTFLGLVHLDLLNRRNLIVGTLSKFLSKSRVEVERAETNVNQQSGKTKEQTCVRKRGRGAVERGSQQWRRLHVESNEMHLTAWLLLTLHLCFAQSIYDFFFPSQHVLFVHTMHIKNPVANNVQITDQYIFCSF